MRLSFPFYSTVLSGCSEFPNYQFRLQFFGKSYRTTMLLLLAIYKNVYARFFAHRSVVIYLLSSTVLFRAALFGAVPCVLSVAQILHQVGAFLNFEILQQVVGVLISLFIHQSGGVFLYIILLQVIIVFQRQFLYQVGKVFLFPKANITLLL